MFLQRNKVRITRSELKSNGLATACLVELLFEENPYMLIFFKRENSFYEGGDHGVLLEAATGCEHLEKDVVSRAARSSCFFFVLGS